jgi:hypothetical protein
VQSREVTLTADAYSIAAVERAVAKAKKASCGVRFGLRGKPGRNIPRSNERAIFALLLNSDTPPSRLPLFSSCDGTWRLRCNRTYTDCGSGEIAGQSWPRNVVDTNRAALQRCTFKSTTPPRLEADLGGPKELARFSIARLLISVIASANSVSQINHILRIPMMSELL